MYCVVNAKRFLLLLSSVMLLMLVAVSNVACGGDDEEGGGGAKDEAPVAKFKEYQLYSVWYAAQVKTSADGEYKDWSSVYADDVTLLNFAKAALVNVCGQLGDGSYSYALDGNTIKFADVTLEVLKFNPSDSPDVVWTMECKVTSAELGTLYVMFTRDTTPNSHASLVDHLCGQWKLVDVPVEYCNQADECYYSFYSDPNRRWYVVLHIRLDVTPSMKYSSYRGRYIAIPNSTPCWAYESLGQGHTDDMYNSKNSTIALSTLSSNTPSRHCGIFLSTHVLYSDLAMRGEYILATRVEKPVTFTVL